MSDEDLRTLERNARDAASRLRYARALERLGRGDEAFRALQEGLDDADVRRELVRFPASDVAGSFDPHFIDVRPIRKKPRLLWRAAAPLTPQDIVASPLGVVVLCKNGSSVRHPRTGDQRWPVAGGAVVRGDRLWTVIDGAFAAFDLWNQEQVASRPAANAEIKARGPHVVLREREKWTALGPAGEERAVTPYASWCDGEREVVTRDSAYELVDLASRATLHAHEPYAAWRSWLMDAAGFATLVARTMLRLHDRPGRELWSSISPGSLEALTPTHVVVRRENELVTIDRATGERETVLPGLRLRAAMSVELHVARDVAYVSLPGQLHAVTLEGEPLWKLDERLSLLRPQPGLVFGKHGRDVVALEEP